jgi:hypothetical protein
MSHILEHDGERFALYHYDSQETVTVEDKQEGILWVFMDEEAQRFWKQYVLSLKHFHIERDWTIDKVINNVLEGYDDELNTLN